MNTSLVLNQPNIFNSIFSLKWKFSLRIFLVLGSVILTACLLFYVFQINLEATERHAIQKYEIKLGEVIRENQILGINLIQANSLENTISLVDQLNFEKIDKIHYIKVVGNKIVAK